MSCSMVNLFHTTADNIGDRMCGPAQYLWPDQFTSAPFVGGIPPAARIAILGGGQIFSHAKRFSAAVKGNTKPILLIGWGLGLPIFGLQNGTVRKVVKRFSAFSTRNFDWREQIDFVPCASCLSPLFDTLNDPQHEVVVYNHRKKPAALNIPSGIPVLSNASNDPSTVLKFIASGETVVTSSYHGVYWAQLLGRRVVCIPYSPKFLTFEYFPTFAEVDTWQREIKTAIRFRPLLHEYRRINFEYASKIEGLWMDYSNNEN